MCTDCNDIPLFAQNYRVRQVAAMFVLEERQPLKGWVIISNLYSWDEADRVARNCGCMVVA